jgi:hypothetical protein
MVFVSDLDKRYLEAERAQAGNDLQAQTTIATYSFIGVSARR